MVTKKKTTLIISIDIWDKFKIYCIQNKKKASQLIEELIKTELKNQNIKKEMVLKKIEDKEKENNQEGKAA
jgi:hypothetical protein